MVHSHYAHCSPRSVVRGSRVCNNNNNNTGTISAPLPDHDLDIDAPAVSIPGIDNNNITKKKNIPDILRASMMAQCADFHESFSESHIKTLIAADIRMISGCEDAQTSSDVDNVANFKLPDPAGRGGGACTSGILQVLYDDHVDTSADLSFEQVILKLRDNLSKMGLQQIPQLSSSRVMNLDEPFHIVPQGSTGTRRAVMIGINYTGQEGALTGCHNDVLNMMEYLKDVHGFQEENIKLLMDDRKHTKPTRKNITTAFKKLAEESQPGDVVFCHFSGHGGKIRDFDGDEADGFDETLIPVDFDKCGQIRDDYLYKTLVCPMREGVTMTCLFDCCHSGTVLDLPFVFIGDGHQDSMGILESLSMDKIEAAAAELKVVESSSTLSPSNKPPLEAASSPTTTRTTKPNIDNADTNGTEARPSGKMQDFYISTGRGSINIKADITDKVGVFKKAIEKKTGIPVDGQELVYNGAYAKFSNDKSLKYYGCQGGAFFQLSEKPGAKQKKGASPLQPIP